MKKSILMAALGLLSLNTIAQDTLKEEGFIFTTVKENPITSVKVGSINSIFYFLHKAAEPFNCLEQDNLA